MRVSIFTLTVFLITTATVFGQPSKKHEPVKSGETEKTTASSEIPPGFKSDKCTLFPDGNYADCCIAHDLDYYRGGKGRHSSDKRLYRCVKSKKGWQNKLFAPMMYIGVRIGGVSFLPTPFRWGFGKKKMKKAREKAALEAKKKQTEQTLNNPTDNKKNN